MHKNPSFQSTGPPGLLNRLLSSISSRRSPATMRCLPLSFLSILAATLLGGLATPLAPHGDRMRVKHAWDAVPENWENLGHPPHATTIALHLALKSHNENALIDALYEVSDPKSLKYVSPLPIRTRVYPPVPLSRHRYGAHLSKEQVAELVAPHPETLELVNSWLEHHGVSSSSISTTHGGSWLTLTGVPVFQANELLGASYQLYQHAGTNDTILRTVGYALPTVLHTHTCKPSHRRRSSPPRARCGRHYAGASLDQRRLWRT